LEGERWISSALISKLVIAPEHANLLPDLTDRQREMLHLLRRGCDNKTISQQMNISIKTVENHLTRLYRKIDVQSRLEAVNFLTRFPQIMGTPGSQAARNEGDAPRGIINSAGILVVDDNNNYRKQLLRMIGKACPQAIIYEAEGVQEALKLAERMEFRLAFVDVILGDENGITFTRRLKILSPNTRIVLISAYPDREFHRQGIESGAAAFLDKKNLDLPTLKQVINDVIT
jgi:DNA-binding NarL/FixJ family response regulator